MSRFKNEVVRLESHIKTLRAGCGVMFGIAVMMGIGWWDAPKNLTIHNPPDLRSGSTRKWWEVPPDTRTLNATARAADGSQAPDLAIDSSALGGMYVGAVKLVGTEAGVGVKLSGDMVAGGDIQIDAAGKVVMGQASAGTTVAVKAASVEAKGAVYAGTDLSVNTQGALTNQQTLAAKDSITLDAGGRLTNNGIIEAGVNADNSRNAKGDVRLKAQAIENTGKTVIASRDLNINTGELTNLGGTLSAQRNAQLSISGNQDIATASSLFNSFKDSMAGAGLDTLNSAVGVLRDPIASIDAMNEFILSVGEGGETFRFGSRWLQIANHAASRCTGCWL